MAAKRKPVDNAVKRRAVRKTPPPEITEAEMDALARAVGKYVRDAPPVLYLYWWDRMPKGRAKRRFEKVLFDAGSLRPQTAARRKAVLRHCRENRALLQAICEGFLSGLKEIRKRRTVKEGGKHG